MSLFDLFGDSGRRMDAGRLLRIEKKLDLVLKHLDLQFEPFSERVRHAAESGDKLLAIKLYRGESGAGLVEAKNVVEAYMKTRSTEEYGK